MVGSATLTTLLPSTCTVTRTVVVVVLTTVTVTATAATIPNVEISRPIIDDGLDEFHLVGLGHFGILERLSFQLFQKHGVPSIPFCAEHNVRVLQP